MGNVLTFGAGWRAGKANADSPNDANAFYRGEVANFQPEERRSAAFRLAVILPALEFMRRRHGGERGVIRLAEGYELRSLSDLVKAVAAECGVATRTIKGWLARFRSGGYDALADRRRRDRGVSRYFAEHADAARFARKLWHDGYSAKGILLSLLRNFSVTPCYHTVRFFLKSLNDQSARTARARKVR